MTTQLFMMPIKPGKKADYLAFLNECMGPRLSEYQEMLKRYDLNTTKIWLQTIDGNDYAAFTHDMGEHAAERLAKWADSAHPFDQWFDAKLRECYTVALADAPPQPEFVGVVEVVA